MRYEKPAILDLNASARRASGNNLFGCVSGGDTGQTSATCGTGGTAYGGCSVGSIAGSLDSCAGGISAAGGDCLSGTTVGGAFYCESGAGGGNDPYGCTVGPSFA